MRNLLKGFMGVSALALATAASAAPPDVTAVVAGIGEAATPIAAIGAAGLLVLVGIKVFKWVRRAF